MAWCPCGTRNRAPKGANNTNQVLQSKRAFKFKGTCSRVTTFLTDSDELVSGFDTFAENKSSGGNMEKLENFEN